MKVLQVLGRLVSKFNFGKELSFIVFISLSLSGDFVYLLCLFRIYFVAAEGSS